MSSEDKKLKEEAAAKFLSLNSIGRPYTPAEFPRIFEDMKKGLDNPLKANLFGDAVSKLGTHAPKIISPRAKISGLTIPIPRKNSPARPWLSGSGALGSYGKIICRPIAIVGEPGQGSFIERMVGGCHHLPALERAFSSSFGPAALAAIKQALSGGGASATGISLHGENFPVFFLPGPGDSDIQASPGGYVDAYVSMGILRREFRSGSDAWWELENERRKNIKSEASRSMTKDEVDQALPRAPRPPQPKWLLTSVSDKMQNAVIGVSGSRSRLFVSFPDVLDQEAADLWSYANEGRFPLIRQPDVAELLVKYASLYVTWRDLAHKPDAMTAKLDALADGAVRRSLWHIEDVRQDLILSHPEKAEAFTAPSVFSVLSKVRVSPAVRSLQSKVDGKTVMSALRSAHFASRLKIKGCTE